MSVTTLTHVRYSLLCRGEYYVKFAQTESPECLPQPDGYHEVKIGDRAWRPFVYRREDSLDQVTIFLVEDDTELHFALLGQIQDRNGWKQSGD
jgi:hypothetical protein